MQAYVWSTFISVNGNSHTLHYRNTNGFDYIILPHDPVGGVYNTSEPYYFVGPKQDNSY